MSSIKPRCATCGHGKDWHRVHGEAECGKGRCLCPKYQLPPFSVIGRVSVPRRSPLKRTKRKILPKCKHCAHSSGVHWELDGTCAYCTACPGYERSRGIHQRRRTPLAAKRLMADDLWTRVVHARPELCEVQQYHAHTCEGGYQAMHGIPRTYQATRYLPINGFKGCAGVHKRFTDRKEEWSALLLEAWGPETFRELWAKARAMQPVDLEATVSRLREELQKVQA